MQKSLSLIALALAGSGVPAAAQVIDQANKRLEILGDSPAACVFSTPSAANARNASFNVTGSTSAQIDITQLVDNQDATSLASSIDLSLPVICNASHRVVVRSTNGGLLRLGGSRLSSGGFNEYLAYQVGLEWAGKTLEQSSEGGTAVFNSAQPASGEMRLHIVTPAGSGPLVAGQYNDSIVIEFQAAN